MGKGSKARPIPDRATFENTWENIWGKKEGASGPLTETDKEKDNDNKSEDTKV
jgi:hypothetical protein